MVCHLEPFPVVRRRTGNMDGADPQDLETEKDACELGLILEIPIEPLKIGVVELFILARMLDCIPESEFEGAHRGPARRG